MKKLSVMFAVTLVAVVLGGCAGVSYTPPQSYAGEIQRQYNHPYQKSWDAVLDMITAPGYKLDQVSKNSGYVSVAHRLRTDSSEVDCGEFDGGSFIQVAEDVSTATIAARFKKLSGNRSEITVIVTGEREIRGVNVWDGSYFRRTYSCETTGELERRVLDYVMNYKE